MNAIIPTDSPIDHASAEMQRVLQLQRKSFQAEGRVSVKTRVDRIERCIDLVFDNRDKLVDAMMTDFGHRSRHQCLMADIYSTLEMAKYNKKQVVKWVRSDKRKVNFPLNLFGAKARIEYQPLGVVGNIGTWNFPVHTVLGPMIGMLAAGNRVMQKFSEVTPATGELLEALFVKYYNEEEVRGFNGGPDVGAAFASLPLDHILFTGATSIGRHILQAAALNLTPVTLELGGKSPVIIDDKADLKDVAERLLAGKVLNAGQVCLSPDYVFVPKAKKEAFIDELRGVTKELFPSGLRDNPDVTSVINARHRQRLQSYIDDACDKGGDVRDLNPLEEDFAQQQGTTKVPFTLIVDPTDDMLVTQEEIFGPLLIIKTYEDVNECIDYINAHDRPLALYLFGKDKILQRKVLDHTLSGGVTINDVMMHVSCEDLPFGGVGASGMGNYHGFEGFKTFSHARSIYTQSKINLMKLGGMLPPYGEKCEKALAGMIKK